MKYLEWFKQNINVVSFVVGLGLITAGKYDLGFELIRGV